MPDGTLRWEHFPHGSDIGVRGVGPRIDSAFEQAALALTAIVADPQTVRTVTRVDIACDAPDREILLADWLNALIWQMAARHLLFGRFEVHVEGTHLSASAFGEPLDLARHAPSVEPKGATLTGLAVRREGTGWVAECVVDV